jgi:hypothetical protein
VRARTQHARVYVRVATQGIDTRTYTVDTPTDAPTDAPTVPSECSKNLIVDNGVAYYQTVYGSTTAAGTGGYVNCNLGYVLGPPGSPNSIQFMCLQGGVWGFWSTATGAYSVLTVPTCNGAHACDARRGLDLCSD